MVNSIDIELTECNNGGEMRIAANDLAFVTGVENMPYLSMFGGQDWWGNDLFLNTGNDFVFSATTEAIMLTTPLNSNGRQIIYDAILADLKYLTKDIPGTTIALDLVIISDDKLSLIINFNGLTFYFLWNPKSATLTQLPTERLYVTEDGSQIYGTEDGSEAYTWS